MDGKSVITYLWDFVIRLSKGMGEVWSWLTESHYIGLKIDWLGINYGFNIVPLEMTGALLVTLLALAFIKAFIPVA